MMQCPHPSREIYHLPEERTAGPDNPTCVLQVANERQQLPLSAWLLGFPFLDHSTQPLQLLMGEANCH